MNSPRDMNPFPRARARAHAAKCTYIGLGLGCSQSAQAGSSYCAEHYALVYKVGSGKQRRKDTRTHDRVRLVETLFQEAIAELELEGFDVYGEPELISGQVQVEVVEE